MNELVGIARMGWPVVGAVVVGWMLNELSHGLRARRETKEAIGKALSELLDVYRYLVGFKLVADLMRSHLPKATAGQVITAVLVHFPLPTGIAERYGAAIASLAGPEPLLAYRLRSKELIPAFIRSLRSIPLPADGSSDALERMLGEKFEAMMLNELRESLLDLARSRSWLMRWRVRRILREPAKLPEDLMEDAKRAIFGVTSGSAVGIVVAMPVSSAATAVARDAT